MRLSQPVDLATKSRAILNPYGEEHAMSLGTSLALSIDSATDVDTNTVNFALQAADIGKSIFSQAGLTPPIEDLLTVSHDVGKAGNKRHLVRRDQTLPNAITGVPSTASVYIVIDVPNASQFTNAVILQILNTLVDFCIEGGAGANVIKVLNNEV
jgi:hypothetical protein